MSLVLQKFDVEVPEHISLALVICGGTDSDSQRHTGFFARTLTGDKFLFHLARNNDFRRSNVSSTYNYIFVPFLEPENEMVIIGFLQFLWAETCGRLAYSIEYSNSDYFDESGALVMTAAGDGFTCATFVLETLRKHGLDMVERSTWPLTDQDSAWQLSILDAAGLSAAQFMAQVEKVGHCPRFRPEHAVGAAHYYEGARLHYGEVHPAGLEVVAEMRRLRA
jgi:hypothetical protein